MIIEINSSFNKDDICICNITYTSKGKILGIQEDVFCELRKDDIELDYLNRQIKHHKYKKIDKIIVDMIRKVGSKAIIT